MANHKSHSAPYRSSLVKVRAEVKRRNAHRRMRGLLLETLEERRLLAVGPQLIGVQPNASDLLTNGDVRIEAPRELTLRFDQEQAIDASTLDGIRVTAAGGDGSFGLASTESDFGSGGAATIRLTASTPGTTYSVQVLNSNLSAGAPPTISRTGSNISIGLNANPASRTTAEELVAAINGSPLLTGRISAELSGGVGDAELARFAARDYSPLPVDQTNDEVITPGVILVGDAPRANEVTLRFSERLAADNYRLEVFGFDDPILGVVGLRNEAGELFQPATPGTRSDRIDFELDLGPQVISVVPQPVVRVDGQLQQQRDTVVVYFDNNKLFVENDDQGNPTANSAENPAFYSLIDTAETVRNTDDIYHRPIEAKYNAMTHSVTLRFADDIDNLAADGTSTFRLRVGTRESAPIVPTKSEAAATAISDFNTDGAVKIRFTSREVGENSGGIQIEVTNSNSGSAPQISVSERTISIDLASQNLTAEELLQALRDSSAVMALVSVDFEPGSDPATVLNTPINYSPIDVAGLGSSFDTASDLGVIGSAITPETSLILSSAIDPKPFELDLPGASDDAAHRQLPAGMGSLEDHVNENFGADSTAGITTIYYNFQEQYSSDPNGQPLVNSITGAQRLRAREVLQLWANHIGVQFVETSDLGVTMATGHLAGLRPSPNTQISTQPGSGFGVRIDPSFENSLLILSAGRNWNSEYGSNYTRTFAAAMGMILGLEKAGDLPETTLMRLDPEFLSGSGPLVDANDQQLTASDERYEPIIPGNQDILHGQYLHRPDSTDIDLFRFEVDFGDGDQVGLFTAETYAQRLPNSSSLNTKLELFRQTQARASTDLGVGPAMRLQFEAVAEGPLGNQLQIFFTQTERSDTSAARLTIFPNAIGIDLNSSEGLETSAQEVVDALRQSNAAQRLVKVQLLSGEPATLVGRNDIAQNPVVLSGGEIKLIAQNDDYFSDDSLLKQSLTTGVYYIGVSASGNDNYNAAVQDSGFGGKSQGDYDLRIRFRTEVDVEDTIRSIASSDPTQPSVGLDGDGNGVPGGAHDFWFQTKPLDRVFQFNSGASAEIEGRTIQLVGANGRQRVFEFDSDGSTSPGRSAITYSLSDSSAQLAQRVANAINARTELGIHVTAIGDEVHLTGERSLTIDSALTLIEVHGRTIFVDKSASPDADGSLQRPFNNISGAGVPNAFASTHPGDIVRIVGNGGTDGDISTIGDNFAYEIGVGLLPGSTLSDGRSMNVPKGVTTMIDAGAIFKLRQAAINVGSTNLNIDRSASALQVLGVPSLRDPAGNPIRNQDGEFTPGNVYFTSWLDESIGLDTFSPTTTPAPGDWGGISFQRDVDLAAGRIDLEEDGMFLRYVNHADIRYGGGRVTIDSVQRTVNSIQLLETRATVTDNRIQFGADAAMSALPDSFEETNFQEPRFQAAGRFTSDYERVGPDIKRNHLVNNSLNGLFIRVTTPADGSLQTMTVPGRFDDTDIVHLISENLLVTGNPGGALLDDTEPLVDLVELSSAVGGSLEPGEYNYKVTFVDRDGYESVPSVASESFDLTVNSDAIRLSGLPTAPGEFTGRRLYRSQPDGSGPYDLVATLDKLNPTFLDVGTTPGGTLARDRADVSNVVLSSDDTGQLDAGTYNYRVVMIDSQGHEGLASHPTDSITLTDDGAVHLDQLPLTSSEYVGRRIYRSADGGNGPYVLIAELRDSDSGSQSTLVDTGDDLGRNLPAESLGVLRPRLSASLVIDPGSVIKLESSRIEATFGAGIIAEGVDGLPIHFTSIRDDTVGAGGTFDTNNNGTASEPAPRDWGGIYMAPASTLSVDHARFAYAGGVTVLDGTFRAFNTIEIQQADARISNTLFENNADGFGGQGPGTRFGRLSNSRATIFVRGAEPIVLGNTFIDNAGNAIEIDVLSMSAEVQSDTGRQRGAVDRSEQYDSNRGPLIRENRFNGNTLNGLHLRAGSILTSASVWDDTDIVHVVSEEIFVSNVQHEGGLRLQSSPTESLVVKFDGYGSNFNEYLGAGITAIGERSTGRERVGGTVHVVGQPGFPVVLTSLRDDSVGAGLKPDGTPQTDTNNDGIGSIPESGDWRGLFFDQYSNDRNVAIVLENESPNAAAPGLNGTVETAQVLGNLARSPSASNENRQLGFVVEGVLSEPADIDVYSFTAVAGTDVWLDVDYTLNNSDFTIELLNANGQLLARSNSSTAEAMDPSLIFTSDLIDPDSVNPLVSTAAGGRMTAAGAIKDDGTTNPKDPGFRVRLPGAEGTRTTYYFRIRSASIDPDNPGAGLSSGPYQVQVRTRAEQEWAGSTVNFADIRYATNGVRLRGLPGESPLIGEAQEDESVRAGETFASNDVATGDGRSPFFGFFNADRQIGNRPQYIGNILNTSLGGISVAGELSSATDLDFYMLEVSQEDIVDFANGLASVTFDIDYADGFDRPDTSLNIFRQEPSNNPFNDFQYRLIYTGNGSNIAEDQPRPFRNADESDLSRGSAGSRDAYIGPVALEQGTYLVGVSSAAYQPRTRILYPFDVKPINSIRRIVDEGHQPGITTADPPVVENFLPRTDIGDDGELVSETFSLGGYSTHDLPSMYLDYTHPGGNFEVLIRDGDGNETLVAASGFNPNIPTLQTGTNSVKIPLTATNRNFAGQDDLTVVFRSDSPTTNINNVIIGFAERGESNLVGDEPALLLSAFLGQNAIQPTREFSLETYTAFGDDPDLEFTYEITDGTLDVFVIDQFGNETFVATSDDGVLVEDQEATAVIDLSPWANQPGLTVEFRTRDQDPTNVRVQNVFVALADGARAFSGEPNPTYVQVPVSSSTVTSGKYQLEVRQAESFFESQSFGAPLLTKSFDTNDRLAEAVSLVAPAGAELTDGDTFELVAGGSARVFEFSTDSQVASGHIRVPVSPSDPAYVVARAIRDAINNPNVRSRLQVSAATSSGFATGTQGRDDRLNLFGSVQVRNVTAANPDGAVEVVYYQGFSDSNITREQGQILIQNSFIRESRDYGVWSEPAQRMMDPRDVNSEFFGGAHPFLQDRPALAGTQAARNLIVGNDEVEGGLLPGVVIQNNVLEEGGLGGINIQGETPIWMLSANVIPALDDDPTENSTDPISHFGFYIDDGDQLVIDADRTRLRLEFDDLAGGAPGNPVGGSGQVQGDGVAESSSVAWYRDTGGDFYQRLTGGELQPFATTALETMHALRDSILGSMLVTNGTTQTIKATVASSLLGPVPGAPLQPSAGYPIYHNRPAVFLEGPGNLHWIDGPNGVGGSPFDLRQLDLGETPQPHARIVNNTIVGKDGRVSFNGESPLDEANDTIDTAVPTWQGTAHNPIFYSEVGVIGDGGPPVAGGGGNRGSTSNSGGSNGSGNGGGGSGGSSFRSSQFLLSFEKDISEQQKAQILDDQGLELVREYGIINGMLVKMTSHRDVIDAVTGLRQIEGIEYAEPDHIRHYAREPNDPRYPEQWHYSNTGQTGGTPGADISLPEAWDTFTGSEDVVIAIVDSGVDYNHPDLVGNMWVNPGEVAGSDTDDDGNGLVDDIHGYDFAENRPDPMDTDGHGTHVAGTTAASGNNALGVSGVNWDAKIMALKVGLDSGGIPTSAVVGAMDYMVTMKTLFGINIVVSNNSYGGFGGSQIESAAIQATIDAGIPFVAAAGNDSNDNDNLPAFPASYPLDGIISVSATDHNDQMAGFSNFGLTSADVAAPGVDILSTTLGGGYGLLSGTSMAAPHVAGVVALMAGSNPDATVADLKSAILLGADPLPGLDGTSVTGARLNAAKSLLVSNAGLSDSLSATDVDIYQFKLGVGERALVDVQTAGSGLDAVLRIFDSSGVPQAFRDANGALVTISGDEAASGQSPGTDPFADFTATKPGVYYAAVSSAGNSGYDPLSFADRSAGDTTGAYRITISARHLQEFVITAQDASAYTPGDTFTIHGVPDNEVTGGTGRTFEFVFGLGGPTNPNNIPINIGEDWRFPDVAKAIAKAINEGGVGRGPAITNEQRLENGKFGFASPLPPVFAKPLGGLTGVFHAPFNNLTGDKAALLESIGAVDGLGFNQVPHRELRRILREDFHEVNQGLELFPRRPDGVITTVTTTIGGEGTFTNIHSLSNLGIGHDRGQTQPLSFTSRADATTEKFISVKNAAWIEGNGTIMVNPDVDSNHNLDQFLPESGVLASRGASPTVLNNVFFNVQSPVIIEESRINANTGGIEPYGSNNPNVITKPGSVVVGGSTYQHYEPSIANVRFATGIETVPTNVPNTNLDLNHEIDAGVRLFENAQAGRYVPAPGSPLIDSAIDTLPERTRLTDVKAAMGIAPSPVVAPQFDLVGQLRADDPDVAPPGGQGQNVFKDRGALERVDFIGPAAIMRNPIDNDAAGIDLDSSDSVIQLASGVYREFRIQLLDGNEPSNPLRGLGIDDSTVVNSLIAGLRKSGAAIILFENGRLLREGIDYSFSYNETRDEIVLTPLAGVWKPNAVYQLGINNQDRFVISAPAGDQVSDGDTFTITDESGGIVTFEFESGYQLQVPQGLKLEIPLAGGGNGGVADGDRFSVHIGSQITTFEFDLNGNTLSGNRPIPFAYGESQQRLTERVIEALTGSGLPIDPVQLSDGRIFIGAASGTLLDTAPTALTQPATTAALQIPALGPRPGGIVDGQAFTVSDGRQTITFEYDNNGSVRTGNQAIDISTAVTANELTALTAVALDSSALAIRPTIASPRLIHLGLSINGSADIDSSRLRLFGVSRTLADGDSFEVITSDGAATFEFDTDGSVEDGSVAIPIDEGASESEIGSAIATAISEGGLGLAPRHVGGGNVYIGGSSDDVIRVENAPALLLTGQPGVQTGTELEIFGPMQIQVPALGGGEITDGSTFAINDGFQTIVFEFDSDSSGPSQPGNVVIEFSPPDSQAVIAAAIVSAINTSPLALQSTNSGSGLISLGSVQNEQVQVRNSNLTLSRGVVSDGEFFSISRSTTTVTFEFANADINGGVTSGRTPIFFDSTTTADSLAQSIKAAIDNSVLGLAPTVLPGGVIRLNDSPQYSTDVSGAPALRLSGVPGSASPVMFIQDDSFTDLNMKQAIIQAINAASGTQLHAKNRGGDTLFVKNALSISSELDSYFLQSVADLAGNPLKANQLNDETEFTILMPGTQLDFGDAPDPFQSTAGRYPTRRVNDGARHVVGDTAILGSTIDAEADGQPSPLADADNDDGVVFGANLDTPGVFNRNVMSSIEVTLNSPGYVDAWIDFNADGDWNDPGEKILDSVLFTEDSLTQTFMVTVPASAPIPEGPITSFARFRSSSAGGLSPTGLAVDGEVEDYAVTIVPGAPPTAVDDSYVLDEDTVLTTSDATGDETPNFPIDDGIAANDQNPEDRTLGVALVTGPEYAEQFNLNSDGTFTYRPRANFFGTDTFTYRVNDGVLSSNNIGTVTLTIREVNDPPIARDDSITIDENEVLDIDQSVLLENDSAGPDPNEDGQTLTITSVDPVSAAGGSVSLQNGRVIYTPPSGYSGPDSFVYTITDDGTTAGDLDPKSDSATVSLTVQDKNEPPIPGTLTLQTEEDTSITVEVASLLANALPGPPDESDQVVSFVGVDLQSTAGGTVTFSDGIITYTPPTNFAGTDTFFYIIEDDGTSGGEPDPQHATGTVTVDVTNVNDPPLVIDPLGSITMEEDESPRLLDLLAVFDDPDINVANDELSFQVISNDNTSLLDATIVGDQLRLELLADQNGLAMIVVEATDLEGESVRDTLTLTVTPVNDAPRLVEPLPEIEVDENASIPGITLSPDHFFDPDTVTDDDTLTFEVVTNSNPLLVSASIDGNVLELELEENASGVAVITVSATDEAGLTVSDELTLIVNPINNPPQTQPDSYSVPQGESLITTDPQGQVGGPEDDGVLANDSDPEGAALTAILVDGPQFASQFTLNSNGTFTYQHDGSSRETDTFTYQASDGETLSAVTTVTIQIDAPPPPPNQNPDNNLDVNADGFVTPIDALLIINFINANGSGLPDFQVPNPPPYLDSNGDGFITPIDALLVINFLNARTPGGGGEGELVAEGEDAPASELGTTTLTAAGNLAPSLAVDFSSSAIVSRNHDNASVGVRRFELYADEVYGPLRSPAARVHESNHSDQTVIIDRLDWADLADPVWVDEDTNASESTPNDLALISIYDGSERDSSPQS